MLQALLFAALLLSQDPKPARTVEDRLKELDEKIAALEKKQKTLLDENATLEKKLADGKAWREKYAVQTAEYWMKRHTTGLALTEKQTTDLQALWIGWAREGFEKRVDETTWKARETTLRGTLTAEQITLLEKAVRTELENGAKVTLSSYGKQAGLAGERNDLFVKTVAGRLSFEGAGLISQAHPGTAITWMSIQAAVEASSAVLAAVLTPEEQARVTKVKSQWRLYREK